MSHLHPEDIQRLLELDKALEAFGALSDVDTPLSLRAKRGNPPDAKGIAAPLRARNDRLGADSALDIPDDLPEEAKRFLLRLRVLKGVPLHYLVPDTAMLPPESLRFFYVDSAWMDTLLDGAMSVARQIQDMAQDALYRSGSAEGASLLSAPVATGVLIRSAIVEHWPDTEVTALDASGTVLPVLRRETLSDHLLLVLFQGEMASLYLKDPLQHSHMAVTLHPSGDGTVPLRDVADPRIGKGNVPVPFRNRERRVVALSSLARSMADALKIPVASDGVAYQLLSQDHELTITLRRSGMVSGKEFPMTYQSDSLLSGYAIRRMQADTPYVAADDALAPTAEPNAAVSINMSNPNSPEPDKAAVLYTDNPEKNALRFRLMNLTGNVQSLTAGKPVPDSQPATYFRLYIAFQDYFDFDALTQIRLDAADAAVWELGAFEEDGNTALCLTLRQNKDWRPDEALTITLRQVTSRSVQPGKQTDVLMTAYDVGVIRETNISAKVLFQAFPTRERKTLTVGLGFVGGKNVVYVSREGRPVIDNTLTVTITNLSETPVPNSPNAVFRLSFITKAKREDGTYPAGYEALTSPDYLNRVKVTQDIAYDTPIQWKITQPEATKAVWELRPQGPVIFDGIRSGKATLQLKVTGIVSFFKPNAVTPLFMDFSDVDGYNDGYITTMVQKLELAEPVFDYLRVDGKETKESGNLFKLNLSQTIDLSWKVLGASYVKIYYDGRPVTVNEVIRLAPEGSAPITIDRPGKITLESDGYDLKPFLTVSILPITITSFDGKSWFEADKIQLRYVLKNTITWNVINATECKLVREFDGKVIAETTSGSITLDQANYATEFSYRLECKGPQENSSFIVRVLTISLPESDRAEAAWYGDIADVYFPVAGTVGGWNPRGGMRVVFESLRNPAVVIKDIQIQQSNNTVYFVRPEEVKYSFSRTDEQTLKRTEFDPNTRGDVVAYSEGEGWFEFTLVSDDGYLEAVVLLRTPGKFSRNHSLYESYPNRDPHGLLRVYFYSEGNDYYTLFNTAKEIYTSKNFGEKLVTLIDKNQDQFPLDFCIDTQRNRIYWINGSTQRVMTGAIVAETLTHITDLCATQRPTDASCAGMTVHLPTGDLLWLESTAEGMGLFRFKRTSETGGEKRLLCILPAQEKSGGLAVV